MNDDIIRFVFNKIQFYFYNYNSNNIFKRKLKNEYNNNFVNDNII